MYMGRRIVEHCILIAFCRKMVREDIVVRLRAIHIEWGRAAREKNARALRLLLEEEENMGEDKKVEGSPKASKSSASKEKTMPLAVSPPGRRQEEEGCAHHPLKSASVFKSLRT